MAEGYLILNTGKNVKVDKQMVGDGNKCVGFLLLRESSGGSIYRGGYGGQ
jgi:hypothetical protein